MSIYIDTTYISGLLSRVDGLTRKSNTLWNLRCPICGDSKKNKTKKRGFFYQKEGRYFYKCHNCSINISLAGFLKYIDNNLYRQYCIESFGSTPKTKKNKPITHHRVKPILLKEATRLTQLSLNHIARKFVDKRMIPKKHHHKLYYVDNFGKFISSTNIKPANDLGSEPRLIIPYFDKKSNVFAIQGRAFDNKGLRYITFRMDKECEAKLPFGVDMLNPNRPVYVVEGPLDSLFIDNCLAVGSSNIVTSSMIGFIYSLNKSETTIVFDNEKRNKEIINKMELAIRQGFNICIWPDNITQKDINDMVIAGHKNIKQIIDDNTYSGLNATLRINNWKKV